MGMVRGPKKGKPRRLSVRRKMLRLRNRQKELRQGRLANLQLDMNRLPMHEALKPLAWLMGTWQTESTGFGKYPTIKPFTYCEEITFESVGQPMLNYTARSWHSETKNPLHFEVGFLRIIPDTNKVCLMLSHNFGVTTIEEGVVNGTLIKLKTTSIERPTEGGKPTIVTELQREFQLLGDSLQHKLYMATSKTPELQEHLCAKYIKKC
ncbi:peroxynitrite isomerase 2-like [Hylaeus volcanicus]|uniref:peroxynitrite isomerase 2-like n=1 Tax=Hylaeus volcanicus TaxID=313075 RepID=UPI0023B78175|nr:peroxynitrite isomerase 2-like [Hylaeus volcanicus]